MNDKFIKIILSARSKTQISTHCLYIYIKLKQENQSTASNVTGMVLSEKVRAANDREEAEDGGVLSFFCFLVWEVFTQVDSLWDI
jgi:hypothetical protein